MCGRVYKCMCVLTKCVVFSPESETVESPFHISQIPEMFSGKLSPITTAPPSTDRILNLYSRHSRDNSQVDLRQPSSRKASAEESNLGLVHTQTTSVPTEDETGHAPSISPGTQAKLQLDMMVHKHSREEPSDPREEDVKVGEDGEQPSSTGDRLLEFEHPEDTSSSDPLTTESSSCWTEDNDEEMG